MKFRNFTGQMPNFVGGFSGGSPTGPFRVPGTLWQLNTYNYNFKLSTGTETAPSGLWFKTDGTKLYVCGQTRNRIRSYDLTIAWDLSTATNLYEMTAILLSDTGVNLTQVNGVSFSDDGTKMFVVDGIANALYRYTLSTAWDISTINSVNADQVNTAIYVGAATPQSIWVKPDGLEFATVNAGTSTGWRGWSSTVANDITTLTNISNITAGNTPCGGVFVDDGKRWVSLRQATDLLEISNVLATPYRLAGWVSNNTRTMTSFDTTPTDIYMKNDGSAYYYSGSAGDGIYYFSRE